MNTQEIDVQLDTRPVIKNCNGCFVPLRSQQWQQNIIDKRQVFLCATCHDTSIRLMQDLIKCMIPIKYSDVITVLKHETVIRNENKRQLEKAQKV